MIQSGGSFEMFDPINPIKVLSKIANKAKNLSIVDIPKNFIKYFRIFSRTGITLTNNEIKDMKVIKCLENREILLWKVYSLH